LNTLKKTLAEFYEYNGKSQDIMVLDNGSKDGTPDWLRSEGFDILSEDVNLGVFDGTMKLWQEALKRGYDFILNLQDDFPCIATIPFDTLEAFLDQEKDVGYIRLNDKKDQTENIVTRKPIVFGEKIKLGNYKFRKYNYHATFNPCLIRSKLVPLFVKDQKKHRERGLMEKFAATGLLAARVYPSMFITLPQRPRINGWKN
jgi:glycosyltransferase involved in cell wall biosynthesis